MKKDTLLFMLFSVLASGLNYLVYPLLSRILPSSEYIDITVALSLLTQISTFLSSIIAITIGISKRESPDTKMKIQALQTFLFKAFLVLSLVFIVLSPAITSSVHLPILFVVPIILMMLFSIPVTVISGYLNGINALTKLGLVALISASLQFIVAITVATTTHNGFFTMITMTVAQLITIFIIYRLFASLSLPSISSPFAPVKKQLLDKKFMIYIAFAAASIMAVSIAQIADLLIIQNIKNVDIKFYTDIYVISRIVFFAGMILIWPFLGKIHISTLRKNFRPFISLVATFIAMGAVAVLALVLGGDIIVKILFNSAYEAQSVGLVGSLSVLFKISMLIITVATLYFIVMHRYMAAIISVVCSGTLISYSLLVDKSIEITTLLVHLNIICGIIALALVLQILYETSRKK